MLKIKNVQLLDDGRSLLDTVGDRRFKVLERSFKDGYNTAKVSFLKDDPVESNERAGKILSFLCGHVSPGGGVNRIVAAVRLK